MLGKILILLVFIAASESMFRPPRPPRYNECSCEDHEEVPCDEDGGTTPPHNQETPSTKPTTTSTSTTVPPTTTPSTTATTPSTSTVTTTSTAVPTTTTVMPCSLFEGASPYKRQNGWWCSQLFLVDITSPNPLSWDVGTNLCKINGYPSVSSLETEAEKREYSTISPVLNVDTFWVNVSFNTTNGQYYWSDGSATPTIEPQPTVIDPNGGGAWTINTSLPGYGSLSIIPRTGNATSSTRAILCGGPG
ncbi:unnamed protein product [Caenorhabditis brenneri]